MEERIKEKTLVLCSGGLDSTVLLYKAVKEAGADNVLALSMFYGQKHSKETEFARWHCDHLGVTLFESDLSDVFRFNIDCSALLKGSKREIEHTSYADQLNKLGGSGTVSAYVPYRNGLFLSYAAAVALQLGCDLIYYGAHADDAAGRAYPDCTPEFIQAQMAAITEGTGHKIEMRAPWWNLNKAQIVSEAIDVLEMTPVELRHTWSCYEGGEEPCGTCGTCIDRRAAFEMNGLIE